MISFYSDFQQLKYVFVEIERETDNQVNLKSNDMTDKSTTNTEIIKLNMLRKENNILNETNKKFIKENQILISKINELDNKIFNFEKEIDIQAEKIKQIVSDEKELEFLKLNLVYSSKCLRSVFNKGYKVGTPEYRKCILKKGKKLND